MTNDNDSKQPEETDIPKIIEQSVLISSIIILCLTFLLYTSIFSIGVVVGDSMEPTFSENDRFIYTTLISPDESDIIVFSDTDSGHEETKLVVHRVIDINESKEHKYITKGDSNLTKDDPVSKDQFKGTVLIHFPSDTLIPQIKPIPNQSLQITSHYFSIILQKMSVVFYGSYRI